MTSEVLSYEDLDPSLARPSTEGELRRHLLWGDRDRPEVKKQWDEDHLTGVALHHAEWVQSPQWGEGRRVWMPGKPGTCPRFSTGELNVWKRGERVWVATVTGTGGRDAKLTTRNRPIHTAHGGALQGAGEMNTHQLPHLTKGWAGAGCWEGGW